MAYGSYVGRVGAQAVGLGVGSAVVAVAVASADTTGSAGLTGSRAADSRSGSSPVSTKAPARETARSAKAGTGADGWRIAHDRPTAVIVVRIVVRPAVSCRKNIVFPEWS